MRYFEDVVVGTVERIGSYTFTADEIKRFAAKFDPQPFHMDEEAAEKSHFRGLCASGWHTAAVWMKLMVAYRKAEMEANSDAQGAPVGPSPGFTDLKWMKPVYAGDTITFVSTIVAKRPLASRPQWGLVTQQNLGTNHRGEAAFSFEANALVAMRLTENAAE